MINVIGMGYIGLPTALMLAANGNVVIGTDYNQTIISRLQQGEITFEEKGLRAIFDTAVNKGIQFSDLYQETDIYCSCTDTLSQGKQTGRCFIYN